VKSQGMNGGEWGSSVGREGAWTGERGMEKVLPGKCNVKMITGKRGI
jgi:hypothetical protein